MIFFLEIIYIMSVNGWICVSAVKKMVHEMALLNWFACVNLNDTWMTAFHSYSKQVGLFSFCKRWKEKTHKVFSFFGRGSINDLNSRCKFTIKHNYYIEIHIVKNTLVTDCLVFAKPMRLFWRSSEKPLVKAYSWAWKCPKDLQINLQK